MCVYLARVHNYWCDRRTFRPQQTWTSSGLPLRVSTLEPPLNTGAEMSSFWRYFHHWLHRKLSFWQLPLQPVVKISSKWHFRFRASSVAWLHWCIHNGKFPQCLLPDYKLVESESTLKADWALLCNRRENFSIYNACCAEFIRRNIKLHFHFLSCLNVVFAFHTIQRDLMIYSCSWILASPWKASTICRPISQIPVYLSHIP